VPATTGGTHETGPGRTAGQVDEQSAGGVNAPGGADPARPLHEGFARTAARLNSLIGRVIRWPRCCASWRGLAEAQHAVAGTMAAIAGPTQAAVGTGRWPRACRCWLRTCIGGTRYGVRASLCCSTAPSSGPSLRRRRGPWRACVRGGVEALEALADDFLHGGVDIADAGCRALRGGDLAGLFHPSGRFLAGAVLASAAPGAGYVPVAARRRSPA